MIIVTGTKRSGTSLWMQILIAAGFPHIGEAFPAEWGQSIRLANSEGFYESRLRHGIYYRTNPDPTTGTFMFPQQVARYAVKVFVPGVIRTDYAYISRVICTMRRWQEYGPSLARLHQMEDAYIAQRRAEGKVVDNDREEESAVRVRRGEIPAWMEWWSENYGMIRDFSVRRYPLQMLTFEKLIADPGVELTRIFKWLGEGNVDAAVSVVKPGLNTQKALPAPEGVDHDLAQVFDDFYDMGNKGERLSPAFAQKLNETHVRVEAIRESLLKTVKTAGQAGG